MLCRTVPGWLPAPGFVATKILIAADLAVVPEPATTPSWPTLDPHRGFAISRRGADFAPARARPARVQAMAENSTIAVALALGCCQPQAAASPRLREHRAESHVATTGLGWEESPATDRSAEWQWPVVADSAGAVGSAQCPCRTQKAAFPALPTDWARTHLARSSCASAASPAPGRFVVSRFPEIAYSAAAVAQPKGSEERRRGPPPAAPVPG